MEIRVTIAFAGVPPLDGAARDRLLAELRAELPGVAPEVAQDQESGRLEVTISGALGALEILGAIPITRAIARLGYGSPRWTTIHAEHVNPARG